MSGISNVSGTHVSKKGNLVVERADGSQDVVTKDGRAIHQNAPGTSRDAYRPTPPAVRGNSRPVPPSTGNTYRPTPPAADPGYDRPTPPPVHVPRYYWQPTFPVIMQNNPRPVPQIELPPSPQPARRVDPSEVSNDVVDLLAGYQRLRDEKKHFFVTTHPDLSAGDAKSKLAAGQTIFLAADGGAHISKDAYKPVKSAKELEPLLPQVRGQKLNDMQNAENRAYQGRVDAWVDTDVQRRIQALPAFNSVYNTDRLALNNMMVSADGRSFNRNMITAMNVYNQSDVRREIAQKWHESPDMGTSEFNRMANSVVSQHVANLYWQSDYMGDWGSYLGTNPVPGLRYPDTQEDVDYNSEVIRRTAAELPILLNNTVND